MKEIQINEIENIRIGNAQNLEAGTGCTVIICERGAVTGLDVRGGGPASRESEITKPLAAAQFVNAVLLSGGSAFGLDAAGGVMRYLEKKDVGFDVGVTKVPLVCESCLFDLTVGDKDVRPDAAMGEQACRNAETNCPEQGCVGAGTGASVGKFLGMDRAMKSGLGFYAVQAGELKVGAVVAVNACGDIFDYDTRRIIAGMMNESGTSFADSEATLCRMAEQQTQMQMTSRLMQNTTIGAVITNARFDKAQMNKIASMAHNGYARTIGPVHTTMDGDSIYAMSVGDVEADMDLVGTLAASVMGRAVNRAAQNASDGYGLISGSTFRRRTGS